MEKNRKARKYNSSKLQELFAEITPIEMEKTKVKMQLATHIEDFIESKGWKKSEFAEKVGKRPSEISKWLSGTQNLTTDVLTEIAYTLGVEIAALFGGVKDEVVYRKEFVVEMVASQPTIFMRTPMDQANSCNWSNAVPYNSFMIPCLNFYHA